MTAQDSLAGGTAGEEPAARQGSTLAAALFLNLPFICDEQDARSLILAAFHAGATGQQCREALAQWRAQRAASVQTVRSEA